MAADLDATSVETVYIHHTSMLTGNIELPEQPLVREAPQFVLQIPAQ